MLIHLNVKVTLGSKPGLPEWKEISFSNLLKINEARTKKINTVKTFGNGRNYIN